MRLAGNVLWTAPARDTPQQSLKLLPARIGRREFPQAQRADFVRRNLEILPPREPGYGQFREPGGAGTPNEEKRKWVCSPAPRAGDFPNFADFPEYTRSTRHRNILRGTLNSAVLYVGFMDSFSRHKDTPSPPSGEVSAEPTEGGSDPRGWRTITFHYAIPARPFPRRTPFFRLRERRNDEFPRNSTRAPAIKDNRFQLHKPSVSTYPLPLMNAFPYPSLFRETSAVSRPDLHPQSGRAGYSRRGSAPQGEPFRPLSVRSERGPLRGERKTNNYRLQKSEVKFHNPAEQNK